MLFELIVGMCSFLNSYVSRVYVCISTTVTAMPDSNHRSTMARICSAR